MGIEIKLRKVTQKNERCEAVFFVKILPLEDKNRKMGKEDLFVVVEKAISGDEAAFAALYQRQLPSIVFGVSTWLNDKNDVEDAASEAVLNMFKSIPDLKSPFAFKAWLQRIIMNTCVAFNTKERKARNADIADYESTLIDNDEDALPEAKVVSGDGDSDMSVAIRALPDAQRRTLTLFYYEEMSYQEIAEALGVTVSAVSTNLIKARNNLKGLIDMDGNINQKNNENEVDRKDVLSAAITTAIGADASKVLSSVHLDGVINASNAKLHAFSTKQAFAAKASVHVAAKLSVVKIAAIVVSCTVILGSGITLAHILDKADDEIVSEYPEVVATNDEPGAVYSPEVTIEFYGDGETKDHINPTSAVLSGLGADDKVIAWYIYNEDKQEVSSGNGSLIEDELSSLTPGKYSAEWVTEDANGDRARAARDFEIKAARDFEIKD
jgi:RNA polymerase sigma-70 factor (ECF subfamily)